jgi:hypothetical protein
VVPLPKGKASSQTLAGWSYQRLNPGFSTGFVSHENRMGNNSRRMKFLFIEVDLFRLV